MINKILLFSIVICNLFYSCKKHTSTPANPVGQLPAATQVGANTFGCLINGEVVVIHKPLFDLSPDYGCQYQLIYPTVSGYSFNVNATDYQDGNHFKGVAIGLDSIQLEQTTYLLNISNSPYARYGYVGIATSSSPLLRYFTDSTVTGQLTITHFDQQQQIVSGTFYFDAIEQTTGDTVHVTNGRFDMHYTD
ncbi:MAG: DUF6252 family protein [Parafilimonas sp.]